MIPAKVITPEMKAKLRLAGSNDINIALAAQREVATAMAIPLKEGVLDGDIASGIFTEQTFEPGQEVEYPVDMIAPGSEKGLIAFTIPNHGKLPQKNFEGDFVRVSTFDVGAVADTNLKYARDARWDVMGRLMQAIETMFVRRKNLDAWHTLLAAGTARNLVPYDDFATAGMFTKRLVAQMEAIMRRNAGGNSTSTNRGKLTDVFMSPEARQDVLSWDLTQIPDAMRQAIWTNWSAGGIAKIGDVTLHDLDELGVGQEFNDYFDVTLGGTFPTDKVEAVVGLDLRNRDSFVNPVRSEIEVFEDPTMHRARRVGFYAWREHGFSVLDSRRVLMGAL